MYKVYKWILRTSFLLAMGASLFACGCPSPCGFKLPMCKGEGCAFSPKSILEAVVVDVLFD